MTRAQRAFAAAATILVLAHLAVAREPLIASRGASRRRPESECPHCDIPPPPRTAPIAPRVLSASDSCGDGARDGVPLAEGERLDWEGLRAAYLAFGGDGWASSACWNVSGPGPVRVCDTGAAGANSSWHGVECGGGRVTGLDLGSNGLAGDLSLLAGVALPELESLVASGNQGLEGSLPANWTGLPALQDLDASGCASVGGTALPLAAAPGSAPPPRLRKVILSGTRLSGALPHQWGANVSHVVMDNTRLSGPFPMRWSAPAMSVVSCFNAPLTGRAESIINSADGLGGVLGLGLEGTLVSGTLPSAGPAALPSLEQLDLFQSQLSGTLPADISAPLPGMKYLVLSSCRLSGTLPSTFTGYESVTTLALYSNRISGTVPDFVGLDSVDRLSLSGLLLSGTLPSAFRIGPGPTAELDLSSNLLSGTVPYRFTGLDAVQSLLLYSNRLSGGLPSQWAGLGSLTKLSLGTNPIGGTLGRDLCRGLSSLTHLELYRSELSGTIPAAFADGCDNLLVLTARENALSGTLPPVVTGLPSLGLLNIGVNRLQGTLPVPWPGVGERLQVLDVSSNNALDGTPFDGRGGGVGAAFPALRVLAVSRNAFSGPLAGLATAPSWLHDRAEDLELESCSFTGALPRGLMVAPHLGVLMIADNKLTSFGEAFEGGGAVMPGINVFGAGGNSFSHVPAALCEARSLHHIDLADNRIVSVPACLGTMPNVAVLDLSSNLLTELPPSFGTGPQAAGLSSLDLSSNLLTFVSLAAAWPAPGGVPAVSSSAAAAAVAASFTTGSVVSLLLASNLLNAGAAEVMDRLVAVFPALFELDLSATGVTGYFTSLPPRLAVLAMAHNEMWSGFDTTLPQLSSLGGVRELDISFTGDSFNIFPPDVDSLRTLRWRGPSAANPCVDAGILGAAKLELLDVRDAAHGCLQRTRMAVVMEEEGGRVFSEIGLRCPSWRLARSGGVVLADATFVGYEECKCADGFVWVGPEASCRPCPVVTPSGRLRCDPYVVAPRPCLVGNVWPALAGSRDGRLATDAEQLAAGGLVRTVLCRVPGACNTGSAACDAVSDFGGLGRHAPDEPPVPLQFRCGSGRDPASFLCSRCLPGHWPSGGQCVPCRPAMRWLVPLALAAMLAGLLAYLWRRSNPARRARGEGTHAVFLLFFWLQLTSALEASSQALGHAGDGGTTWAWVTAVRGALQSWAVLQPWAPQCVAGAGDDGSPSRPDYLDETLGLLLVPFAVVAAGGAVRLAVSDRAAGTRVATVCATLVAMLELPVASRAVAVFGCESSGSVTFLSAAPYAVCEWSGRLLAARILALFALFAFVLPFTAATLAALRARRRCRADGSGSSQSLALIDHAPATSPKLESGDSSDLSHSLLRAAGSGGGGRFEELPVDDGDEHRLFAAGRTSLAAAVGSALWVASEGPLLRGDGAVKWHWPVSHDSARRLVLATIFGMFSPVSPVLPVAVLAVLAVSAFACALQRPWRNRLDNATELLVLASASAVYTISIVAGAESRLDASSSSASNPVTRSFVSLVHVSVLLLLAARVALRYKAAPRSQRA